MRDGGARLDEDAFGPLLQFYGASGIEGVLVLGTTGEGVLLEPCERRRAAELAIAAAAQTLRVIVHCGAQTTAATSALAAHAAQAGADGVAVIAPPYFPLRESELVVHFADRGSGLRTAPVLRLRVRRPQRVRGLAGGRLAAARACLQPRRHEGVR